jgi:hypothetical protein
VKWLNTKQRRIATNQDAPKFSVQHNFGIKGVLGSEYNYNFTELEIYKRFWTPSWGRIDTYIKAGAQWNRVPFPYLIVPPANLSYIKDDNTFSLLTNMEFLNDRYVALFSSWELNGKILNRLPLIRHLKLREYFGFSAMWGSLTSKNNPFLAQNQGDARVFYFPGEYDASGNFRYISSAMDHGKPYVEAYFGLYNIFKFFNVEYVRRLTYLDNPEETVLATVTVPTQIVEPEPEEEELAEGEELPEGEVPEGEEAAEGAAESGREPEADAGDQGTIEG